MSPRVAEGDMYALKQLTRRKKEREKEENEKNEGYLV
jgi:hypothetical protein